MADTIKKRIAPIAHRLDLSYMIRLSGQYDIFPFYHVISDFHLPHIRHLYRYRRLNEFEKDLEEMLKWFEPVTLADYLEVEQKGKEKGKGNRIGKGKGKGKGRMVLTFDDGLEECHQTIAPLLKKKGVPAAFFLNNQFIDNRGLFFRYKASLIIDEVLSDCKAKEKAAKYLVIPEEKVVDAIRMVKYGQQELLDELARQVGVDFIDYLREDPVYMTSQQVKELVDWGFEIGGHSPDHADFSTLDPAVMISQVKDNIEDLQQRFGVSSRFFSFPFTSDGVPGEVIDTLLNDRIADVLLGTAGLKKTGKQGFIQRIPMEDYEMPFKDALKTEYLYFLMKIPVGSNTIRY